jgi:hypothetical protein
MLCWCVRAIYDGYCWLLYSTFGVTCVADPQLLVENLLECKCGVPTASVSVRQCKAQQQQVFGTTISASADVGESAVCVCVWRSVIMSIPQMGLFIAAKFKSRSSTVTENVLRTRE